MDLVPFLRGSGKPWVLYSLEYCRRGDSQLFHQHIAAAAAGQLVRAAGGCLKEKALLTDIKAV